ncbi:MAG TPA: YihY/virulence factor BrkB family protein [Comamonadaceae bacterium]|uniref:YihY/virulence factor BrkB family protein n=1 Tax=Pulveribacter sp. TaxID=2678893 RepID=UPI000EB86921|nr:YihY/virulence factor BrkB family protein [Pulveribacter sp.]HCL85968.1 YihY/virulence factor BrkB family protein [Comamonadaceae bacterium]
MNFKHIFDLGKKAVSAWLDDFAPSMGAAISYYTVFSLAPLLVIVIAIAGAIFGREAVMGQITGQLTGLIGRDGANLVQGLVASASDTDRGLVAGTISVVVLLVGATTVFAELQSALDRIWHVPEREKPQGLWAVLRARLLSFGLILGLAFMLMVSLVVGAATSAFGGWIGGLMPASELLLHVVNVAVSLAFTSVLFAMIFKLMPSTPVAWRDVGIGAVVTAVLFEAGKVLIGLYIGKSGITESFQAAGSLVVLLAWVYYAAQIFLLGAEFTKVYADEHGSCSAARATAATQATAEAGIPQEAAGHGAALPAVAALPLPGARTPQPDLQTAVVGVQLGVAGVKVLYELAAIAALHLAARVLSHRRKAALHKIKSLRT